MFLASSIDRTLDFVAREFDIEPAETPVLFVANAADPYEDTWWVELDRKKFKELGYPVTEADVCDMSAEDFTSAIEKSSILHFAGGSVFHLMHLLRKNGLEEGVVNAVRSGKVIYTGTSAGSIVVSGSIASYSYDEEEVEHIKKVPEKTGLGLVDFVIVPHCNNPDYAVQSSNIAGHLPDLPEPHMFLHDNQAVVVQDNNLKIIAS